MFDRRDYRIYKGIKKEVIYQPICDFWARNGFYVTQASAFHIYGQSYYQKIGLRREFWLTIGESGGDSHVDLVFQAKITDEGLVGGAAAAVIFLPVAVVGGAISYSEYEEDANRLIHGFWLHLDSVAGKSGQAAAPTAPAPQPAQQTVTMGACVGCGALIPDTWKACPYCGKAR